MYTFNQLWEPAGLLVAKTRLNAVNQQIYPSGAIQPHFAQRSIDKRLKLAADGREEGVTVKFLAVAWRSSHDLNSQDEQIALHAGTSPLSFTTKPRIWEKQREKLYYLSHHEFKL